MQVPRTTPKGSAYSSPSLEPFGVSRRLIITQKAQCNADCGRSVMCLALVLPRKASAWAKPTSRHDLVDHRLQANVCGVTRVRKTQTDVPVPCFLFLNVRAVLLN